MNTFVRCLGLLLAFSLSSSAVLGYSTTQAKAYLPGVTTAELSTRTPVRLVSVEQIRQSLEGKPPLVVGFDVDDTILYVSAGFARGKRLYSPGSDAYLKNATFWELMNGGWDEFSIPKQAGQDLIAMHQARGDKIYFITGRPATKDEQLTRIIQQNFSIKDMNPVVFVGDLNKTKAMKERGVQLYYGDADQDVTSALAAGARPIRVLRAVNSSNQPLPNNGSYGEEVLVNSDY